MSKRAFLVAVGLIVGAFLWGYRGEWLLRQESPKQESPKGPEVQPTPRISNGATPKTTTTTLRPALPAIPLQGPPQRAAPSPEPVVEDEEPLPEEELDSSEVDQAEEGEVTEDEADAGSEEVDEPAEAGDEGDEPLEEEPAE